VITGATVVVVVVVVVSPFSSVSVCSGGSARPSAFGVFSFGR